MNMEKERRAFQKFCEENFDFEHHEQTYFDEQTQCYENDIGECTESINMAWDAWQASANRQGYKLVPIEPTQEMLDKFPEVVYQDTYAGECSLWVDNETLRFGYKAMIGACDE